MGKTMTAAGIQSALTGVGGTLILAIFCSTFLTIEKVLLIIPLFIAFNGAMTGFRLVEVMKDKIQNAGFYSFIMGIGGGAATFSIVNMTGWMMNNPFGLGITDIVIYIFVSGVTSYLGARLAARYFNL